MRVRPSTKDINIGHRQQLHQSHTHRIKLRINCVRVLDRAPPEPRLSLTPGDFVRLP